jgi:hypothetical protein
MKIIETPFMVGEDQIGTVKRYADNFPELANPQPRDRVLPAPYFYETRMFFSLIKQREPGEPGWPRGGYEVRDEGGASRCFDLDQVILHPSVVKHRRTLNMMNRTEEKAERKRVSDLQRGLKPKKEKVEGGRRGRPALDPEVKIARELEKVARAERSGGKRGRPASGVTPKTPKISTGGKRGRPSLTSEMISQRASQKAMVKARTGGRRGRPKTTRR